MAFGERKKLGDKYRTALTATVLTYIETSKQLRSDPLGMGRLSSLGSIVLGGELAKKTGKNIKPKDSVYWVAVNPNTGKMAGQVRIASDLSKWRKKLNKQLKAWGEKSDVKQLAKKRLVTGAIVAGVTTAVVIAVVLTAGAAAGPAAAAAAAQGGGGAAAAGGGGSALTGMMQGLKAINAAAKAGQSLSGQANAATAALPPEQAEMVVSDAESSVAPIWESPYFWLGVTGVVGTGVLAAVVLTRD